MEDARLAYRTRTAVAADDVALRAAIGSSLAHPDGQGRRESYRGAANRGDLLVLERYDRQEKEWRMAGFAECHMRVDDTLSIRDLGTVGDEPQAGVVRYLLDQAFGSYRPAAAQVKIRRDATAWLEILAAIPGFTPDGEEYRRPHYWAIWQWSPERARAAARPARQPGPQSQPQSPPRPPMRPLPNGQRSPAPGPTGDRGRRHDEPARPAFNPPRGPGPRRGPPGGRPGAPRPR